MRNLLLIVLLVLVGGSVCLVAVGAAVLSFFEIPDRAMESTLHQGDRVAESPLLNKDIARGSIVAFHPPNDPALTLVSRVVGVPGDHIRVKEGHLVLNGKEVNEPYVRIAPNRPRMNFPATAEEQNVSEDRLESEEIRRLQSVMYGEWIKEGELIVPEGNYFFLGDNRGSSIDSRSYGPVAKESLSARPLIVYAGKTASSGLRFVESYDLK